MHYKMMTLAMVSAVLCAGSVLAAEPPLQMNRAERAALRTSSVSVAQAISIAEAQGHGRVTNIVSRPRGDRDVYHVTLFADGRLRAGRVDGLTGTFTPDEMLGRPGHAEPISLCVIKQIRAEHRSGQGRCPCVVPPAAGGPADHENSRYRRLPPTRGRPSDPSRPEPTGAGRNLPRPPRATPHDKAGHPLAAIRQNAHNCIRRRIPPDAIAPLFTAVPTLPAAS